MPRWRKNIKTVHSSLWEGLNMLKESQEQCALFEWAAYNLGNKPELKLMFHVPNGGWRKPREAARLKREGVKPGVPDVCLPVPKGMYHGLWIEMKAKGNYPTPEQRIWLKNLNLQGYYAVCCHCWEEAKNVIENYLGETLKKLC